MNEENCFHIYLQKAMINNKQHYRIVSARKTLHIYWNTLKQSFKLANYHHELDESVEVVSHAIETKAYHDFKLARFSTCNSMNRYKMMSNCCEDFSYSSLFDKYSYIRGTKCFNMLLLRQHIVWLSLVLIFGIYLVAAEYNNTPQPSEEDNSSSEETVEDSNESRRKRSLEATSVDNNNKVGDGNVMPRAGIPGLPDPMTILKVAEILQALGEKVVPILVEGNSVANLVAERLDKDYAFLKDLKKEIDSLTY